MLATFLALYSCVLLCGSADEPQSGRPLREGCSGIIDSFLYIREEYHIRVGGCFNGALVAIEDDYITIRGERGIAREFRVSPTLVSNRIPLPQQGGHRLSQLRIGDGVSVALSPARDGPVCTALAIGKRPGGVIPVAEDDFRPDSSRLHIRCNLWQVLEDKVIPALRVAKLFAR